MNFKSHVTLKYIVIFISLTLFAFQITAQDQDNDLQKLRQEMEKEYHSIHHRLDMLEKSIDDILWYHKVGDIAHVDKVRHVGPPLSKSQIENPTAMGAANKVKFYSYIFIPRKINTNKKYPLLIFPHGGVHSNFSTYYTHIVRELITQGYIIIAPDYRGSTGYGQDMYEKIDYGGLEIEDVYAAKEYMIENYDFLDPGRVGMLGWSHGGLITLMNLFSHPGQFKVAYAGVPVSDLVARMGYMTDSYRDLYSAKYHIGKTANENVQEYRRRSPAWNADKYDGTPLLIHTNTNDDDVNVLEVEHLIKSLKVTGKKFRYKIFKDADGGHSFDRLDTLFAKKTRLEIYAFLSQYLNPANPIKDLKSLNKAGYPGF